MDLIFDIGDPMSLSFKMNDPLNLTFETGRTVVTSENKGIDASIYTTTADIEELSDTAIISYSGWNYWQETNDTAKSESTLTAKPGTDCLLVAAIMHRSGGVTLDGDGWTKLVDSESVEPSNKNQYITVFTKHVTAGSYTVTATLQKNAMASLKLITLYETSGLTVVEDRLIPTSTITPIGTTGKRRLYMLHSVFAESGSNPPMAIKLHSSNTKKELRFAEEVRFSVFYDWRPDGETPVFAYPFSTNYAGLLVLDIEEEDQNGN